MAGSTGPPHSKQSIMSYLKFDCSYYLVKPE